MADHVLAPGRAGGRRAPKRAETVDATRFLRGVGAAMPAHPLVDVDAMKLTWNMDHNDEVGICVGAGSKHALETIFKVLGQVFKDWDDAKLLRFYQTQNPGFKDWSYAGSDADGGMDIQTALETLVAWGDILAFGAIDVTNPDALRAATYVGLAIITGETLVEQNMSEQVWDAHPSSPGIGGHCTVWVGYDPRLRQVTWGELLSMTDAFVSRRVEEAWFILTTAHLAVPGFRDQFDLAGFAAAISALTKGKVVVPVTPPVPPVTPPVTDGPFPGADPAVAARVASAAVRAHLTTSAWLNKHLHSYFNIH